MSAIEQTQAIIRRQRVAKLATEMEAALLWMGEFHDSCPRAFGDHWRSMVMPVVEKLRDVQATK